MSGKIFIPLSGRIFLHPMEPEYTSSQVYTKPSPWTDKVMDGT
jgi:hypothetical protein